MKSIDFSRSDRLGDLIKSEISLILKNDVKDPRLHGLTIVSVELSKDIRRALIYFSSFNSFNEAHKEDVLTGIEKAKGFIRTLLSKRLKIKRVPELVFKQDTSELFL